MGHKVFFFFKSFFFKCIFRGSGGTDFEILFGCLQPGLCHCVFSLCTGLPKKTLDMSLITFDNKKALEIMNSV